MHSSVAPHLQALLAASQNEADVPHAAEVPHLHALAELSHVGANLFPLQDVAVPHMQVPD